MKYYMPNIVDEGIFVPRDWTSKDFAAAIVHGTKQRNSSLQSAYWMTIKFGLA